MSDYGTGMTPNVTGYGEVNFFEKSFEKALDAAHSDGSVAPPQAHRPSLSANLKPTSIQLISPPSDGACVLNKEEYLNSQSMAMSSTAMIQDQPNNSIKYSPMIQPSSLSYGFVHPPRPMPIMIERPMFYASPSFPPPQPIHHHQQRPVFNQPPPQQPQIPILNPINMMKDPAEEQSWLSNVQKVKANSLEKQLKSQEKNRLAAMKSRQRKKQEWERLVDAEKELLNENQRLRQRIVSLEAELDTLKAIMSKK